MATRRLDDIPPSDRYNREDVLRSIKMFYECGYTVDIDYTNNRLYFGKDNAGPDYIDMGKIKPGAVSPMPDPEIMIGGAIRTTSDRIDKKGPGRWIKGHIAHICLLLILIIIAGVILSYHPSGSAQISTTVTPTITSTVSPDRPDPTAVPTTISCVGTWTGQDATGTQTIIMMPNGSFTHEIEQNGSTRVYTGHYYPEADGRGNGTTLDYDSFAQNVHYIADVRFDDDTASFQAIGYVPGMPVSMMLFRGLSTVPDVIATPTPTPAATTDQGMVNVNSQPDNLVNSLNPPEYTETLDSELDAQDNDIVLTDYSDVRDPTWDQVKAFIEQDNTDLMPYVYPTFTCANFAERVHDDAEAQGIRAGIACISFDSQQIDYSPFNYGPGWTPPPPTMGGHVVDVFNTTDKGLVYIDCTNVEANETHDCIAYIQVGQEYNCLDFGLADNNFDYSHYEDIRGQYIDYINILRQYNDEVDEYNKELDGNNNQENNTLSAEYASIQNLKAQLDSMPQSTWIFYYPLGKVSGVQIFW